MNMTNSVELFNDSSYKSWACGIYSLRFTACEPNIPSQRHDNEGMLNFAAMLYLYEEFQLQRSLKPLASARY